MKEKLLGLILLVISSVAAADTCVTNAYNATRYGFGVGINSHKEALEVAVSVCLPEVFLNDYKATRWGHGIGINSHEEALEVAKLAYSNVIEVADYTATRFGHSSNAINSHKEALEFAIEVSKSKSNL